jgi:hypothetical protein
MQNSSNSSFARGNGMEEEAKVRYDSIEFDMNQPSSGEPPKTLLSGFGD